MKEPIKIIIPARGCCKTEYIKEQIRELKKQNPCGTIIAVRKNEIEYSRIAAEIEKMRKELEMKSKDAPCPFYCEGRDKEMYNRGFKNACVVLREHFKRKAIEEGMKK